MKKYHTPECIMGILALLMILSGCAGQSAPTKFYMMGAGEKAPPSYLFDAAQGGPLVGVGPVEIPAYLDRPQIVTRMGQNAMNLAEFDKWAEPLEDTFSRLALGMITRELSSKGVGVLPWQGSVEMDYQVTLTVIRLDNNSSGDALLSVRWSLFKADKQLITAQVSSYATPYNSQDFESFAAAQGRNLESLCKDISEVLKQQLASSTILNTIN